MGNTRTTIALQSLDRHPANTLSRRQIIFFAGHNYELSQNFRNASSLNRTNCPSIRVLVGNCDTLLPPLSGDVLLVPKQEFQL